MQGQAYPTDIDPSARPSQFDDVLGTCGELELMLGRLRREHLLPEDEFSQCRREVERIREQLTSRQVYWEPRHATGRCPHCHTSGIVDYVDGLESRHRRQKCLGCGKVLPGDTVGRTADREHTEEGLLARVHRETDTPSRV